MHRTVAQIRGRENETNDNTNGFMGSRQVMSGLILFVTYLLHSFSEPDKYFLMAFSILLYKMKGYIQVWLLKFMAFIAIEQHFPQIMVIDNFC